MSKLSWQLLKLRITEYLKYDSWVFTRLTNSTLFICWYLLSKLGWNKQALKMAGTVHRSQLLPSACKMIECWLRTAQTKQALQQAVITSCLNEPVPGNARRYDDDPQKLIGTRMLVIKKYQASEKGVMVLDYSHLFPIFLRRFDHESIAKRYHIILEPSWIGFCTSELLGFLNQPYPVFVQAFEQADHEFLQNLQSNLHPLPIAANWWVDHRLFRPDPAVSKDSDVIMIGAWGPYKRHSRLFAALARLRSRGDILKTICVGYPSTWKLPQMVHLAKHYGVADQLEFHEWLNSSEVNKMLNRAKVNIIWSKKEGSNRALVEGMLSGVPGILLKGHNYGLEYRHLNDQTGWFVSEKELPDKLFQYCKNEHKSNSRDWILKHMSCQSATSVINTVLQEYANSMGQPWSHDCVVKVSGLHSMDYWNASDKSLFDEDYAWIKSQILVNS